MKWGAKYQERSTGGSETPPNNSQRVSKGNSLFFRTTITSLFHASLKDKINAPPTNPDEQYIPKSLSRIMDLKEKTKSGAFAKKKKAAKDKEVKTNKQDLVQRRGESDKSFLNRVERACQTVIQEAEFQKKYGVEIKKNPKTGQVEQIVKRKRDEIDELMQKARKNKSKTVKKTVKKDEGAPTRLTKVEKRKEKLKQKKEKKLKRNVDEFEKYKDSVKFGETVHAPPNLMLPKKGAHKIVPRVRKSQLFLNKTNECVKCNERVVLFCLETSSLLDLKLR